MFTRPRDLPDAALIDALSVGWDLRVLKLEYRAVGFGSHHWYATDASGGEWFVTVDELDARRQSSHDTTGHAFERLRTALRTARAVRDAGAAFVVAPVATRHGEVLLRMSGRFAVALYPYIDGVSRRGEYASASDRLAVLEIIVTLHAVPAVISCDARTDDFMLPDRDELVRALGDLAERWECGPYAEPARRLLSRHATGLERLLAHYDRLADEARAQPDRVVLTHGEPHIENVIVAGTECMLIDWETTLVAPPERDLWMVDSGDGAVIDRYAEVTGRQTLPAVLDLYRLRWDLAEVAIYVARFRRPHSESADTRECWKNLRYFLDPASRWPSLVGSKHA